MSDTIKPALTPEQWATPANEFGQRFLDGWRDGCTSRWWPSGTLYVNCYGAVCDSERQLVRESRHALAALALHGLVVDGQPVGFTREDVRMLMEDVTLYDDSNPRAQRVYAAVTNLASRIEALLSPEAP